MDTALRRAVEYVFSIACVARMLGYDEDLLADITSDTGTDDSSP